MTESENPERRFYTLRRAAGYLSRAGLQCTYLTVYAWVRRGKLRAVKINKAWYITREELDRFLAELGNSGEWLNLHGAAA